MCAYLQEILMSKKHIWSILAVIVLCGIIQLLLPSRDSMAERGKTDETEQKVEAKEENQEFGKDYLDKYKDYEPPSSLMQQFFVAMLLVAVLGTAAFLLSKKIVPKLTMTKGRNLSVIETVSIGPRKNLHVVEIAGKRNLLIASTNEHISFISDITETMADSRQSSDQTSGEQND